MGEWLHAPVLIGIAQPIKDKKAQRSSSRPPPQPETLPKSRAGLWRPLQRRAAPSDRHPL